MSESEELSEEEYELGWKGLQKSSPEKARLNMTLEPIGPKASIKVRLHPWQVKLVTEALCSRISESRKLPANLLGLNIRKAYYEQNRQLQGADRIVQECEEAIADIYNSVEMQKMQLEAWAKEQAKLSEVSEE